MCIKELYKVATSCIYASLVSMQQREGIIAAAAANKEIHTRRTQQRRTPNKETVRHEKHAWSARSIRLAVKKNS